MEQNSLCPSQRNADKEKLPMKQIMKTPQENINCLHCGKIFSRHSHLILHTYRAHKTTVYLSKKSSSVYKYKCQQKSHEETCTSTYQSQSST